MTTNGRLELAFPTVARINKGLPKTPSSPGKDLKDGLRVTFYPGAGEYRDLFIQAHPELNGKEIKPDQLLTVKRLHAMMPFAKVWDSLQIHNEAHSAGRMVFKATDERVLVRRTPTGEYLVRNGEPYEAYDPLTEKVITYENSKGTVTLPIRTSIRLRLFIPEMMRMVSLELKSTSYYDALNLRQQLGAIQMLADMLNGGVAGGIPFFVFRREQMVTWNKKDGSAARVPQWLLNIEVDPRWVAAATARMQNFALTGQQLAGLLQPTVPLEGTEDPSQGHEDPEEDPQPGEPESGQPSQEQIEIRANATEGQVRAESTPATAPTASQPAAKPERPYPPERLGQRLTEIANSIFAANRQLKESPALRERIKLALEQMLDGHAIDCGQDVPTARAALLYFLTGHRDIKQAPIQMILAMQTWLKPVQVGDSPEYQIDPTAAIEAVAAYQYALNKESK